MKPPGEELERLERAVAVAAATVDSMVEAVLVFDRDGRLVSINRAGIEMHGFSEAAKVPTHLRDWTPLFECQTWDGRALPEDQWPVRRALRGEIARRVQMRVRRKDTGASWWGSYSAVPVVEAGEVSLVVVTVHDQTEIVQVNETLRRVNELSAALSADLNLDRIVQELTDACTEVTGAEFGAFFYNMVDARGESYTLYTLSGAPREAFARFPMPRNTDVFGPTFRGEGIVRLDDVTADPRYGKNVPHKGMPEGHLPVRSYLAVPVTSRSGSVLGGLFFGHSQVGVFTEVHESFVVSFAAQAAIAIDNARLYQELREMNAELERRVAERTAQLSEANRELEGFTYSVSHDLRAPLRAISGTSHILMEDFGALVPPDAKPLLDRQARASEKLARLIEDLLERSRIGRKGMSVARFDLSQLAREVADEVRLLGYANCVFDVQSGMTAIGDAEMVRYVLQNLLTNACKFSPEGGRVQVGAHEGAFFVRDQGIGFDMRHADRLFEPFHRLVREDEFPGTGIGLANVKRIIERHGGRVWAQSKPNHGATFWFTLPAT